MTFLRAVPPVLFTFPAKTQLPNIVRGWEGGGGLLLLDQLSLNFALEDVQPPSPPTHNRLLVWNFGVSLEAPSFPSLSVTERDLDFFYATHVGLFGDS